MTKLRKKRYRKKYPTPPAMDYIIRDLKMKAFARVDKKMKLGKLTPSGLNDLEKKELKNLILSCPNKDLDTEFKRRKFMFRVVQIIYKVTMMREKWEYGMDDYQDVKILEAKFPSLLTLDSDEFYTWVNEGRRKAGKPEITLVHRGETDYLFNAQHQHCILKEESPQDEKDREENMRYCRKKD